MYDVILMTTNYRGALIHITPLIPTLLAKEICPLVGDLYIGPWNKVHV